MTFPDCGSLIETALREDLGELPLDLTSACLIPAGLHGTAQFVVRQPGVVAGLPALEAVNAAMGGHCRVQPTAGDGDRVAAGTRIATVDGPLRAVLGLERTVLNLLTHL